MWCCGGGFVTIGGLLLLGLMFGASKGESGIVSYQDLPEKLHMRVSVRNLSPFEDVPACHEVRVEVELDNLHPKDPLVIHSVSLEHGETVWKSAPGQGVEGGFHRQHPRSTWDASDMPPQFHINWLAAPISSLSIQPGQVMMLPMTFLPRFPPQPHLTQDYERPSSSVYADSSDTMDLQPRRTPSVWQQADLEEWLVGSSPQVQLNYDSDDDLETDTEGSVQSRKHRSNRYAQGDNLRNQIYEVRTNIVYDTNRGVVKFPVTATSRRWHDYGLPDTIYFDWRSSDAAASAAEEASPPLASNNHHEPATPVTSMPSTTSDRAAARIVPRRGILDPDGGGVFIMDSKLPNLPLENQNSTSMTIPGYHSLTGYKDCYDVYLRHSGLHDGSLEVSEARLSTGQYLSLEILPDRGLAASLLSTKPQQSIQRWTELGPLTIPPDDDSHYVLTVCAWDTDTSSDPIHETRMFQEVSPLFETSNMKRTLGSLFIRVGGRPLYIALEEKDEVMRQSNLAWSQSSSPVLIDSEKGRRKRVPTDLAAVPESIDLTFLPSGVASRIISVGLTNRSPRPVSIMRASIALKLNWTTQLDDYGIQLDIHDIRRNLTVQSGATIPNAIKLRCSLDWNLIQENNITGPFSVFGALLIRGTAKQWNYSEYYSAVRTNMPMEASLALEVPLTVQLSHGELCFLFHGSSHPYPAFWSMKPWIEGHEAVSSAFFPLTPLDAQVAVSEGGLNTKVETRSIEHHLRVASSFGTLSALKEVRVLDRYPSLTDVNSSSTSLCSRFEASISNIALSYASELLDLGAGLVHLRYIFPSNLLGRGQVQMNRTATVVPTICYLSVSTEPDLGLHLLPLIIYPGQIDVSGHPLESDSVEAPSGPVEKRANWYHVIVGFERMMEWFQSTKIGQSLRSILDGSKTGSKNTERDGILLGRYLYSLAKQSVNLDKSRLRPVLLKAGAIAQGELETLPIYLTNYNPVPIGISIDVGEVEGMSISLGRDESNGRGDGNSVLDHLQKGRDLKADKISMRDRRIMNGVFRGHPVSGLKQFLSSDVIATGFLSMFPFRDSISMSEMAVVRLPLLKSLFSQYAREQFHKVPLPYRFYPDAWNRCDNSVHPPRYGQFDRKLPEKRLPGPLIISNDSKTSRRLPVCWDKDGDPRSERSDGEVILPPGGVARFDIRLRSPPSDVLERDITEFLATGLVLSTNHGEVIPVFVLFEALQGKLDVSHIPSHASPKTTSMDSVIKVPVGLFGSPSQTFDERVSIPPRRSQGRNNGTELLTHNVTFTDRGVPLFVQSSFLRDIHLRKLTSCNPWFEVKLSKLASEKASDSTLGVNIGEIRSIVPCDDEFGLNANETLFPSFFRCALHWLSKRKELQPRGCGLSPSQEKRIEARGNGQFGENVGIERILRSLKRALLLTEWNDVFESDAIVVTDTFHYARKSGRRSRDGVVAPITVDVVAEAWEALKSVVNFGMGVVSTNLRATIEYNSTADEKYVFRTPSNSLEAHVLSLAIRNLTVETSLEAPSLFDASMARSHLAYAKQGSFDFPSIVEYQPTLVGTARAISISVANPTSIPIRVRLAAGPSTQLFTSAGEFSANSDVRYRFLGNFAPPYIQGQSRAQGSMKDVLNRQWWERSGGFFHASPHGDLIRSAQNVTIKSGSGAQFTLINPSMMFNSAFLVGCGDRCGLRDENLGKSVNAENLINLSPSSPIGASAAAGFVLIGHDRSVGGDGGRSTDSHMLGAGGSLLTNGDGPSAFALPFPALDEVVIPPFGRSEIGPVVFRPPGRTQFMGCDVFTKGKEPDICQSQLFETMIFLENSLSGLERVVLRGRAIWERIIFLDSLSDGFSDIELRNSRTTLMFSGSGNIVNGSTLPMQKEVLVRNEGDNVVTIKRMYFTRSSLPNGKAKAAKEKESKQLCELGEFTLLYCNSRSGMGSFQLRPGEDRSLFVEHRPRCARRRDFVTLNVELDHDEDANSTTSTGRWDQHWSFPDKARGFLPKQQQNPFREKVVELVIGFDLSEAGLSSCNPVLMLASAPEKTLCEGSSSGKCHSTKDGRGSNGSLGHLAIFIARGISALAGFAGVALMTSVYLWRKKVLGRKNIWYIHPSAPQSPLTTRIAKNWPAAFRCLARADPCSADLLALSREQTRQVVLARYRALGAFSPQCINSAGIFHRERNHSANLPVRQPTTNKQPSSNSERVRTISDAIFSKYAPNRASSAGPMNCQIGWRAPASKGLINAESLEKSPIKLRTRDLRLRRSKHITSQDELADVSVDPSGESVTVSEAFNESTGELDLSDESSLDDGEANAADSIHDNQHDNMNSTVTPESTLSPGEDDDDDDGDISRDTTRDKDENDSTSHLVDTKGDGVVNDATAISESSLPKGRENELFTPVTRDESSSEPGDEQCRKEGVHRRLTSELADNGVIPDGSPRGNRRRGKLLPEKDGHLVKDELTYETKKKPRGERQRKAKQLASTEDRVSNRKSRNSRKALAAKASDSVPAAFGGRSPALRPPPGLGPPPGFGTSTLFPPSNSSLPPGLSGDRLILNGGRSQSPSMGSNIGNHVGPNDLNVLDSHSAIVLLRSLSGESLPLSPQPSPALRPVGASNDGGRVARGGLDTVSPLDGLLSPLALNSTTASNFATEPTTNNRSAYEDHSEVSMAGFDVMDFLDGILNDGGGSLLEEASDRGSEGGLGLDHTTGLLLGSSSLPSSAASGSLAFHSNPWASTSAAENTNSSTLDSYQSRLATYGVSFDELAEDSNSRLPLAMVGGDGALLTGGADGGADPPGLELPDLLAPSTSSILRSVVGRDDDGSGRAGGDDFYATLLGE